MAMPKNDYQSPRGTKDILPSEQPFWRVVRDVSDKVLSGLAFERIDIPHFENIEIYNRGIGDDTDIVQKQMFTLANPTLTEDSTIFALRPEGTAGIVRSYIQNGMSSWPQPVRLYYFGAMFRHERPQKGRYREFYQLGVEIFGDESSKSDYLVIMAAWEILNELGLKNLKVYANSIGCPNCRPKYINKLKKYYKNKLSDLCPDCQQRLSKNPLRLLDCKEENCQKIAQNSPVILDSLCSECRTQFQDTLQYLEYFDIKYDLDPTLVRGFDYYTNTVFEIADKNDKKRSNSVCGGGRYNDLVKLLGGPDTPAVGFSIGIERVVDLIKEQGIKPSKIRGVEVCILQLGDKAKEVCKKIYDGLNKADINIYFVPSNDGLKQQLGMAAKLGAKFALIIGQREALKDEIILRDLTASSQEVIPSMSLVEDVKEKLNKLNTCGNEPEKS